MANIKFSQFTVGNTQSDIDFVVGYKGPDNVQISPTNLLASSLGNYLPLAGGTMTGNLEIIDNIQLQMGNGLDFRLYHDAANSIMSSGTGDLYIQNTANDKDIIFRSDDGAGGLAEYFRVDGGAEAIIVSKNVQHADNVRAYFGNAIDLAIYHDGSNSYIENLTGILNINSGTTDTVANFNSSDPSVAVNFIASDNSMQIATSGTDGILKNNGAGSLRFFNNGGEKVRIDSSGNVGIGTTSPAVKLDVVGTIDTDNLTISGNQGTVGQVLTSTGTGVQWQTGGGGASSLNDLSDVLIDGTSNYFVNIPAGLASGSPANNLVIGNNTGNSLTSGFSNILLGASAGASITSGEENVIIGDTAGDALVLTDRNTIIGNNAASEVTSCQMLLALGNNAARNMTSNSLYNIALGEDTNTITSGSGRNICIGHRVLRTASSAQFNTCVGTFAGTAMNTGSNNALFGYYAGIAARGDNNVLLGYEAGATGTNDLTTGDNNVVIGAGSEVSAATVSNEVNIYNGSVTARFQGAAAAWSFVSDARDKKDVEDLELGLDFVTKLKPRKFKWDLRNSNVDKNKEASGFIAQEVKEVLDEIENDYTGIVDTNNPDQYTVSQANIIPMLVNAIKELKQEINDLKCKTCQ